MKYMTGLFLTLAIIYAALVGLLFVFQRQIMYAPDKAIGTPEQYGLSGFSDERTMSADGISIQLWYRKSNEGFPTIVYYHGNAAHLGDRAGILSALADKGFGVLAVSYRGYGKSEGSPSEQGLYQDARAAIQFLMDQKILAERLMLYGESLGTGVATQMATEYPVGGLILQAPYTSVAGRAAEIYYYVPVRYLIRDRYDSIDKIAKVKAPLLLFHGELDTIIPVIHGRRLFDRATCLKKAFFLSHTAHNDFDSSAISSHVLDFAREHHLVAP
jgi:uncharacterized protein